MTAPKNPYEFTDTILLRQIRRRVDWGDERLDHLLEVVECRLWGRALQLEELRGSANAVSLQRLKRTEERQAATLAELETLRAELETLRDRLDPPRESRPQLTLLRGEGS